MNDNDTPFDKLDLTSLFNVRDWMKGAIEAQGAIFLGGSVGVKGEFGVADLSIEIGGHQFIVEVRPVAQS